MFHVEHSTLSVPASPEDIDVAWGDTRNTACLGYRVWVYPCQFLAGFRRQRLDRIVVKLAFDMDIFQAVYLVGDDLPRRM